MVDQQYHSLQWWPENFVNNYIVAVSEKDAINLKDNFDIIGMLSYGKENFIAMSHTKSELTGGKRRYRIKNWCK